MADPVEIKRNSTELAKIFGLTRERVNQLARAGTLPRKTARSAFDLEATTAAYIKYLRERGGGIDEEVDGESESQARTRLTKARADIHERTALQLSGHLIPLEHVESAWVKILSQVRQHLIALPDRIAPIAHDANTLEEVRHLIKDGVCDILEELSSTEIEFDESEQHSADWASRVGRGSVQEHVRTQAPSPTHR